MSSSNFIKNVAIVGAGGNSGSFMTEELLKTGKHTVTAITREGSDSPIPEGVHVKKVKYDDPSTLVEALKGQDALVITMGTMAPPDTQSKLIRAAGDAGVPWILPNEWAPDTTNEALCKDVSFFQHAGAVRKEIVDYGKSSYLAVTCGFWYEWSLAIPGAYGFDIKNKTATFFDDGETKISTSTWPQVGRAVASLLSLPIKPEGDSSEECLENFGNKQIFIKSFTLSQREMLDSVLRVTDTKESDWTITKEPAKERFENAMEGMGKGDRNAYVVVMYTRAFFADGVGDYETGKGVANGILRLPEEDLDEATKIAVERNRTNPYGYAHNK